MKKLIFKSAIIISLVFTSSFSLLLLSIPTVQAQIKTPYKFQIEIPGLAKEMSIGEVDGDVIKSSLLKNYIVGVYNYSFAIAGVLAAVVLMGGGVLWLISGGSPGKIGQAKKIIGNSLIGLVLLFGSNLILRTINPELLAMKDLETIKIDRDEKDANKNEKTCCCCSYSGRPRGGNESTRKNLPVGGACTEDAVFNDKDCKELCDEKWKKFKGRTDLYLDRKDYTFKPNYKCEISDVSKGQQVAMCVPRNNTKDIELVDGVHANNFDTNLWNFTENDGIIINQVGDASDELVTFLNCMGKQLKEKGTISSISDKRHIGSLGDCNKNKCEKEDVDSDDYCVHSCNSCHYGGGLSTNKSYAVDLVPSIMADKYEAAADSCNNKAKFIKEATHIHISIPPCPKDGR